MKIQVKESRVNEILNKGKSIFFANDEVTITPEQMKEIERAIEE